MVCSSTNYSLDATPTGSTVSWSTSNGLLLSINSSTGTATPGTGAGGWVTVTATVNASCGTVILTKTVWAGNPDLNKSVNGASTGLYAVYPGNLYNLSATSNSPDSPSFNYTDITGSGDMSISLYTPNSANTQMYVNGTSTNGSRHVRVTATNSCGSYYQDIVFFIPSFFKAAYPNPAKDYLTLEFNDLSDKTGLPDAIELINEKSIKRELTLSINDLLKDTKNRDGNKYRLDIRHLERGVWYLHAVKKGHETEVVRLLFN